MAQRTESILSLMTFLAVLFISAAHIYFVEGVRGSDQFWYLADTETLAKDLPPLTNMVFPGNVLRAGTADIDTYFAHNGPLLHINAQLARYIGSNDAWKYTNLLFFLLAALFTGLTLAYLSSRTWGYLGAIVYLLTPINVWLAGNFLQETFFGLLSSVVFYACVTEDGARLKKVLLLFALTLGTLSHPLYLIVGVFYGFYGICISRTWTMPSLAIGVVVSASVLKGIWFPTSFPASIKDLIASSIPNVANSIWQLSDTVPAISPDFLISKFVHALRVQFLPSIETPLYLVTNVGLVSLAALFFISRCRNWRFFYMSVIFMLSYGGMIVLMQNQARYQLFITPIAIICTLLWLARWRSIKVRVGILVAVLTLYSAIDFKMLQKIQIESQSGKQGVAVFESAFGFIEPDARVALLGNTLGGWLSVISSLRPVHTMPVFRRLLSEESFSRVIDLYRADYIFTREGYSIDELAQAEHFITVENPDFFNVVIYRWHAD